MCVYIFWNVGVSICGMHTFYSRVYTVFIFVFDDASQCITFSMYLFMLEVFYLYFYKAISLFLCLSFPFLTFQLKWLLFFLRNCSPVCFLSTSGQFNVSPTEDGFELRDTWQLSHMRFIDGPDNGPNPLPPLPPLKQWEYINTYTHTHQFSIQIDFKENLYTYRHRKTLTNNTYNHNIFVQIVYIFNTNIETFLFPFLVLQSLQFSFRDHIIYNMFRYILFSFYSFVFFKRHFSLLYKSFSLSLLLIFASFFWYIIFHYLGLNFMRI